MPITTRSGRTVRALKEVDLPIEMICHILQYADLKELLNYRFVKRSWNEAAFRILSTSPHLQPFTVKLDTSTIADRLLSLRSTAFQPSFLTNFHVVLSEFNISTVTRFGLEFGGCLRQLTMDTRKKTTSLKRMKAKVHELLKHCPLIDTLTIIGNNDGTSFMEDIEEVDLCRVKTLTLKSPYDPVLSIIRHAVIKQWTGKLRHLSKLNVACTLDPNENGQLKQFLVELGPLDHLSLCLRFKPENRTIFRSLAAAKIKIHDLNLVVDMDEDDDQNLLFLNLYTWLAWQGRHLTRVTHQLHTQITEGPILNKLKLFGQPLRTAGRSGQPFRNGQSSSLYFVSVLSNDPNEPVEEDPPETHIGLFANMEQSIISINKKTSRILKYLFPNMKIVHSTHYFVA